MKARHNPVLLRHAWLAAAVLAGSVLLGLSGCRDQSDAPQMPKQYGDLPGLTTTHYQPLRDELARLVQERATPAQLAGQVTRRREGAAAPSNAVVAVFGDDLEALNTQAERLLPEGHFRFTPVGLLAARQFRVQNDAQRARYRSLLQQGDAIEADHRNGLLADLQIVDATRLGNRLEAFLAAEQLAAGELAETMDTVRCLFHVPQQLAREKHLVLRLAALQLRGEAWSVVQSLVLHPDANRAVFERLLTIVERQLASWPSDADALIGERAVGLHTYELIRDGHLLSVLNSTEIEQLQKNGQLDALLESVRENVDTDEHFYLQMMRRIVDSCQQPYYQRVDLLKSVRQEIEQRRSRPDHAWIADNLMLTDFEDAHYLLALDRAHAEAWHNALCVALGREPPHASCPLDGNPYRMEETNGQLAVYLPDQPGDAILVVPLRHAAEPMAESEAP